MSADVASDDVMVREAPTWVRRLTGGVVFVVAVIAFIGSYAHMVSIGYDVGEGKLSWLTPIVVDGLAIAASMVLLVGKRAGKRRRDLWLARLTQLFALAASVAANYAAAEPSPGARAWALIPPVFLFLAYELLLQQVRVVEARPVPVEPQEVPEPPRERFPAPEVRQVPDIPLVAAYGDRLAEQPALPEHTGPAVEHGPPAPLEGRTPVDVARPQPKRKPRKPAAKATTRADASKPLSPRATELLEHARQIAADGPVTATEMVEALTERCGTFGGTPRSALMTAAREEGLIQ